MKGRTKIFIFISSIICSLLFISLSIPLILKNIPPNDIYGVRIPKAFESDALWYEVNYFGGIAIGIAGGVLLLGSIVLFFFRKKLNANAYTGIFVTLMLICLFVASGITSWYVQGLS